jgi:hypothetical protein
MYLFVLKKYSITRLVRRGSELSVSRVALNNFNHPSPLDYFVEILQISRGDRWGSIRADAIGSVTGEHIILYESRRQLFSQQIYLYTRKLPIIIIIIIIPCIYIHTYINVIQVVNVLIKTNEFCVCSGKIINVRRKSDLFSQSLCNIYV